MRLAHAAVKKLSHGVSSIGWGGSANDSEDEETAEVLLVCDELWLPDIMLSQTQGRAGGSANWYFTLIVMSKPY